MLLLSRSLRRGLSSCVFVAVFGIYSLLTSLGGRSLEEYVPDCNVAGERTVDGAIRNITTPTNIPAAVPPEIYTQTETNPLPAAESVTSGSVLAPSLVEADLVAALEERIREVSLPSASNGRLGGDDAHLAALRFELETSAARSKILADKLQEKHQKLDALMKTVRETHSELKKQTTLALTNMAQVEAERSVSTPQDEQSDVEKPTGEETSNATSSLPPEKEESAKTTTETVIKDSLKKRKDKSGRKVEEAESQEEKSEGSEDTSLAKSATSKLLRKRKKAEKLKKLKKKKRKKKKKKKGTQQVEDTNVWASDFEGHVEINLPKKEPWTRLPMEEVLDTKNQAIVGDVSGLIDFAVLGQAKCGTTFLQNWLKKRDDTVMFNSEECTWLDQNETVLASRMYTQPNETDKAYGIKCPFEWEKEALMRFQDHYKKTRLVFGVRHPIRWFKSLYDHKNKYLLPKDPFPMPDANDLIGDCKEISRSRNVCTDRANYHQQLALLGKTPMMAEELELFPFPEKIGGGTVDNPLFLYELEQFSDTNSTRRDTLIRDLENFMGLSGQYDIPQNPSKAKSKSPKLDICDPKYDDLRGIILEAAQQSAWWIRHYLLKSKTVYVSNREHFLQLLETWNIDPCAEETS